MVACVTCCKYIHTECISAWEVACKKPTTCPLCRQIWRRYGESEGSARVEAGEGYVNLAVEQGLPHYRVGFRRRYYYFHLHVCKIKKEEKFVINQVLLTQLIHISSR